MKIAHGKRTYESPGREKTEAGKVRWVQLDGPDDVGGLAGQRWGWPDKDGDGRTKMGMAGQRWGWPDEDGDDRTKMGTTGQRWGRPDKDGDEP